MAWKWLLGLVVFLGLTGCGYKGDLYMPEDRQDRDHVPAILEKITGVAAEKDAKEEDPNK